MNRQTVSYLTGRFKETGFRPDTRHGQNFLIDLNLVELIARTAEIEPRDVILEVGTGTGSLTVMLATQAAAVLTVEIDAHLHQIASEELVSHANVTMLRHDALRNKNNLHDAVLAGLAELLEAEPGRQLKLVSNLPYNIATPVISNLLAGPTVPQLMSVTIQKEVADRITARPRTKDYGALSVWVQCQCDAEIVRVLPPGVFWPRPKVDSAIIRIQLNPAKRARIDDLAGFHRFIRAMFFHRRKFLRSVILSAYKGVLDKPAVDQLMGRLALAADCRAEQLDIDTFLALFAETTQFLSERA